MDIDCCVDCSSLGLGLNKYESRPTFTYDASCLVLAQKSLDYREVLATMAQCHEFKNYDEKSWLSKHYDSAILGIYL